MLYVDANRDDMLTWLPKGGRLAEVGVFAGAFSRQILDVVKPEHIDLIDSWKWYYCDWDNPPDDKVANIEAYKAWAKSIDPEYDGGHPDRMYDRFHAGLVALSKTDQRVAVHRGVSVPTAAKFADASLDAVYIDADHSYDNVLADLTAYAPKVKAGGLILGDDFLDDETRTDSVYGTIQAVNTFTKRGAWKCLAVIGPSACQYVLHREMSPYVDEFLTGIINSGRHIIEVNDVLVGRFFQKKLRSSKATRDIASFL